MKKDLTGTGNPHGARRSSGNRPGRSSARLSPGLFTMLGRGAACLLWALLVPAVSPARLAATEDASVLRKGKIEGNLYLAGRRVVVSGELNGDLWAAGESVESEGLVAGDVNAAAGEVAARGNATGDLRAAAGRLDVAGRVGGDLLAAAGTVRIAPDALVEGNARLAAGTVVVAGDLGRSLAAMAGNIIISGSIRGDATLYATRIELAPTARIGGNLTYRSARPPLIEPGAVVGGEVRRAGLGTGQRLARAGRLVAGGGTLFFGPLVCGILILLLIPRFSVGAARTLAGEPLKSLGAGLVLFAALPALVLLLVMTLIGIPLALALAAAYPIALLLGYLTGVICLGDAGVRLVARNEAIFRGREIAGFVAALLLMAVAARARHAGGWIVAVIAISGMGGWSIHAWRGMRRG